MIPAPEKFERVYPIGPDALYDAITATLTAGGAYKKVEADRFTRSASFATKGIITSVGHRWQAQVIAVPEGSRVSLTAVTNAFAGSSSARALKFADQLFKEVSARCAAMAA